MPRCLTTVKHTLIVATHGIALFPGIIPIGKERFQVGNVVLLRKPDATEIEAVITGIELPTPNPRGEFIPVFKDLGKDDSVGTESGIAMADKPRRVGFIPTIFPNTIAVLR